VNRKVLVAGLAVTLPLGVLLLLSLGRDPHKVDSPLIGKTAPAFRLVPVGGGAPVALADLRGKPVVLNFWATWCVPCYQEHAALQEAARTMSGDVQFLGVIYQDEEPQVADFMRKQGSAYASLLDAESRTAIAYGVYGVPETFFIGPDGTIVDKFVGALSAEDIGERIQKARSGVRGASR
jgi:cytochrome c biogenesis protein CcmG/thiol:disulfide interchange protein DsbE